MGKRSASVKNVELVLSLHYIVDKRRIEVGSFSSTSGALFEDWTNTFQGGNRPLREGTKEDIARSRVCF